MKAGLRAVVWGYRQALRLYPAQVRAAYGLEMEDVFAQGCHEAARVSAWEVTSLAARELWDLPVNLLREHWDAGRHGRMQARQRFAMPKSMLRGLLAIGLIFFTVFLAFGLADTLLNGGKTMEDVSSAPWNLVFLRPSVLACVLSAPWLGRSLRRARLAGSVLAIYLVMTLVSLLGTPIMNPPRLEAGGLWRGLVLPFGYMAAAGLVFGGLVGWLQHDRRQVAFYALLGAGSFMLGWFVDRTISALIVELWAPGGWLVNTVIGSPMYFAYFCIPAGLRGALIGLCLGVAELQREAKSIPL